MKHVSLILAVLAISAVAASASEILTPVAAGTAYGSGFQPGQNSFDAQPIWDGTKPVGGEGLGVDAPYYTPTTEIPLRYAYIDLGEDWATWRIEGGWTLYRAWSGGAQPSWINVQWTSNDPSAWPTAIGDPNNIAEPAIKFNYAANNPNSGSQLWVQNWDSSAAPIVPQARWLILSTDPAFTYNRGREWAFVGYKVPEPATMSLLGLGALALIRRRK